MFLHIQEKLAATEEQLKEAKRERQDKRGGSACCFEFALPVLKSTPHSLSGTCGSRAEEQKKQAVLDEQKKKLARHSITAAFFAQQRDTSHTDSRRRSGRNVCLSRRIWTSECRASTHKHTDTIV